MQRNTTIVMDNATFHKTPKTKSLIESFGCHLLYLPTYSPDLNPIDIVGTPSKVASDL
ncbi:transposase [Wolbachia endosymbiont of Zygogramma bicolorata]|uniref:transposase n=1 Tax=Wolbachia endosymbiont of Zygogramma bicolorata TaxID=3134048 RepID=UPI003DA916C8